MQTSNRTRRHLREWSEANLLDTTNTPVWIFDVTQHRMWWANKAAVEFWRAKSLDDLISRDFSSDSLTVRRRLRQVIDHALPDGSVQDTWTLYPSGDPMTMRVNMTPVFVDEDARDAILIEAIAIDRSDTLVADLRLLEATRYTDIMISYFTMDGDLITMNPAAIEVFDGTMLSTPDAKGSAVRGAASLQSRFVDSAQGHSLIEECLNRQDPSGECLIHTTEGPRWHKVDLRLGRDPLTGNSTIIAMEEDINELKRALLDLEALTETLEERIAQRTEELAIAKQQAEEANEGKSQFLAHMSHELRTPLNSIIGFSEMMSNQVYGELGDPRYKGYVTDIQNSGYHLLHLVNDILDLTKIEADKFELYEEEIDLGALLGSCLDMIRGRREAESLTFRSELPSQSVRIKGDERALKQVALNLLSNAVKYNVDGGEVSFAVNSNNDKSITLSVSDTGIGIAAKDIPKVQEPFSQVRPDSFRAYEGTGLGLSLSKQLVELHGGQLEIESELGKGTTVTVSLPPDRTR